MKDTMTTDTGRWPGRRKHRPPYPPMPSETWERRIAYLRQALSHLQDSTTPGPDIGLLGGGHGPLTSVTVAPDPESGEPAVYITTQDPNLKPRWFPPEAFAMVDLLLAFGGGLSVDPNGKGFAYVRLYSANDRIMYGRLVTNAGPGDVVFQVDASGKRTTHLNQSPKWFTKITAKAVAGDGRPRKTPRAGRPEAIGIALRLFRENRHLAQMTVSEAEYRATLEDVFRLLDAAYPQPATEDSTPDAADLSRREDARPAAQPHNPSTPTQTTEDREA